MRFIVCSYFTKDKVYPKHARNLIESLEKFGITHDVVCIDSLGSWQKNTHYKPTFALEMLEKHYPLSIVVVDADAIFCRYPEYFNKLDNCPEVNIAVHVLDHSKYKRNHLVPELLSGTIFLKNTAKTKQIIDSWIQECKKDPKIWDQRALDVVLKKCKYHLLPEQYCTIFDYMSSVENPVIKHFQASRENRRGVTTKRKRNVSTPRRVIKNGTVRIRRIY